MKTINLLPKTRQQELRYESLLHSLWIIFSMSLVSFALVFLCQFAAKFYLEAKAKSISTQISQLQNAVNNQQEAQLKNQIQQANNTIVDFKNLAASAPKWSQLIVAFTPLPPAGVQINSFVVSPQNNSIVITGFSPSRELVIQLYNNILADNKDFYNIDYPLDNVVNPANVNFHFTFYYRSGLIQ